MDCYIKTEPDYFDEDWESEDGFVEEPIISENSSESLEGININILFKE